MSNWFKLIIEWNENLNGVKWEDKRLKIIMIVSWVSCESGNGDHFPISPFRHSSLEIVELFCINSFIRVQFHSEINICATGTAFQFFFFILKFMWGYQTAKWTRKKCWTEQNESRAIIGATCVYQLITLFPFFFSRFLIVEIVAHVSRYVVCYFDTLAVA